MNQFRGRSRISTPTLQWCKGPPLVNHVPSVIYSACLLDSLYGFERNDHLVEWEIVSSIPILPYFIEYYYKTRVFKWRDARARGGGREGGIPSDTFNVGPVLV